MASVQERRAWAAALPGITVSAVLGEGAFGTVFAAEHDTLGAVAIKVVDDVAQVDAFDVRHPNVVRIHAVERRADHALVVMERVSGVDLLRWVRPPATAATKLRPTLPLAFGTPLQEGGLSAFRAIERDGLARLRPALIQLAQGLSALHAAGKVHRDVKPQNVLVEPSGRAVLVDVGLVVDEGAQRPQWEQLAGAPAYLAPDDVPTAASDWYGVGVCIFEALTGALPFAGTAHEVIVRKRTVSAPSPGFVCPLPDVEDAHVLDALCVKLLRRAASLRPTGPEVLEALRAR